MIVILLQMLQQQQQHHTEMKSGWIRQSRRSSWFEINFQAMWTQGWADPVGWFGFIKLLDEVENIYRSSPVRQWLVFWGERQWGNVSSVSSTIHLPCPRHCAWLTGHLKGESPQQQTPLTQTSNLSELMPSVSLRWQVWKGASTFPLQLRSEKPLTSAGCEQ